MKIKKPDDGISKYLAAESTLEEEETLFDQENTPPELAKWASYVKQKKKKAPPHLKEAIWKTIQSRKRKKQQVLYGLSGIAASISLVIVFFMVADDKNKSYSEKEVTLIEALSLFSEENQLPEKPGILYEDELVIVYKTAE